MKRLSTSEPLTADDVAERVSKAAMRLLSILMDYRQQEGDLFKEISGSRYLDAGVLQAVYKELGDANELDRGAHRVGI